MTPVGARAVVALYSGKTTVKGDSRRKQARALLAKGAILS